MFRYITKPDAKSCCSVYLIEVLMHAYHVACATQILQMSEER